MADDNDTPAVPPSQDPAAGAKAHAASQQAVFSPTPKVNAPTPGKQDAPEGDYRLTVSVWHELVHIENGVKSFVKHVYGDIVHLKTDEAERLLRAGAVQPTTDEQKRTEAAQAQTPFDAAKRLDALAGAQPVNAV